MYLPPADTNEEIALAIEGIRESVAEITEAVDSLSDESISSWKSRYATAIANGALVPA